MFLFTCGNYISSCLIFYQCWALNRMIIKLNHLFSRIYPSCHLFRDFHSGYAALLQLFEDGRSANKKAGKKTAKSVVGRENKKKENVDVNNKENLNGRCDAAANKAVKRGAGGNQKQPGIKAFLTGATTVPVTGAAESSPEIVMKRPAKAVFKKLTVPTAQATITTAVSYVGRREAEEQPVSTAAVMTAAELMLSRLSLDNRRPLDRADETGDFNDSDIW
jgi:hypothetical protein